MSEITFETIASQEEWTTQQKIEILLEYIGNQKSDDVFKDYLVEKTNRETRSRL